MTNLLDQSIFTFKTDILTLSNKIYCKGRPMKIIYSCRSQIMVARSHFVTGLSLV